MPWAAQPQLSVGNAGQLRPVGALSKPRGVIASAGRDAASRRGDAVQGNHIQIEVKSAIITAFNVAPVLTIEK